jgi:chromosome segregation ATPase
MGTTNGKKTWIDNLKDFLGVAKPLAISLGIGFVLGAFVIWTVNACTSKPGSNVIAKYEGEIRDLQGALSSTKGELEKLRANYDGITRDLQTAIDESSRSKSRASNLAQQLTKTTTELSTAAAKLRGYEGRISELEGRISGYAAAAGEVQQLLEGFSNGISSIDDRIKLCTDLIKLGTDKVEQLRKIQEDSRRLIDSSTVESGQYDTRN